MREINMVSHRNMFAFPGWVPSLQFLSRLAIKRQIPSLISSYVSRLDLPNCLCDYLTFKY